MNYKYSVLMSVYFKEKSEYLDLSIESMLNQSVFPDEFIIVKDGVLPDSLNEVIDKYKHQYPRLFTIIINKTNIGLGPSLRRGVLCSRNEIIARMDSDDISKSDRIEKQLEVLNCNPNIGIVGCFEAEFIDTADNIVSVHKVPQNNVEIRHFMKRRCGLLHPTVIFKKHDVISSGNYQSCNYYPLYEDYDLFVRMLFDNNVKAYNLQDSLYLMRTDSHFYERRGGFKYALTAIRFKWHLYKKNISNFVDFVISGLGQAFVCVVPNKLRKLIYLKLLR